MERNDVEKVIEAILPYVNIDTKALLMTIATEPIEAIPDGMESLAYVLSEVVWRDIEGDNAGILAHWDKRIILEVTHKKSGQGNPTWYLKCEGDSIVYLRQSNKQDMVTLYPKFEDMSLGEIVTEVDIVIYTTPDDKGFFNIEKIMPDGIFNYYGETNAQRKVRVIDKHITQLNSDTVYMDTETTGLDESAEIVSIATQCGIETHYKYILPVDIHKLTVKGKNGKSASDFNRIKPSDLVNAPIFPEIYEKIKTLLEGKTVVTYGDFDKKMLDRVCKQHDLPEIEFDNVNLMTIYAEYHGEPGKRGGHKWQTLSDAYFQMTKRKLENAHDAMADVQAMVDIVYELQCLSVI